MSRKMSLSIPADRIVSGTSQQILDVQHPAASEADEEKPGARVHFQIAESVEEQVAAEIRKAKFAS